MPISFNPNRLIKAIKRRLTLVPELRHAEVVVVSIKKSGRTWLRAMLTRLFHNVYGTPDNLLIDADNHKALNNSAPSVFFAHDSDPVARADEVTADLSIYDGKRVVLLVRHPADIVVSLYHHYRNRKTGRRQQLALEATIYDFAMRPNHGIHTIISFLNNWARYVKNNPNVVVVKYEDLHADTAAQLKMLAALMKVPAAAGDIDDAIKFASLENLRKLESEGFFDHVSLRKTSTSNPEGLKVRRGRVAGYLDDFTPQQCSEIDRIVETELDPWYGYGKVRQAAPV